LTNLEWVHSLSAVELAEWFGRNTICEFIQDYDHVWCHRRPYCQGCVSEWLKAEEQQTELVDKMGGVSIN